VNYRKPNVSREIYDVIVRVHGKRIGEKNPIMYSKWTTIQAVTEIASCTSISC